VASGVVGAGHGRRVRPDQDASDDELDADLWPEEEQVQQLQVQELLQELLQEEAQALGGAALEACGNEALRSLHALAGLSNPESLRISADCSAAS
jgi:hypothetical protein